MIRNANLIRDRTGQDNKGQNYSLFSDTLQGKIKAKR